MLSPKRGGPKIEMARLINEKPYAYQVLTQIEQLEDGELRPLVLTLKDKFGLLSPPTKKTEPLAQESAAPPVPKKSPPPAGRYKYGPRG